MSRRSTLLFLILILSLAAGTVRAACGLIPATYPVYAASNLQMDNYVKVNGNYLNPVDFNGGSRDAVETDGDVVAASLSLPDPDPATFPSFSSSTDMTNPGTLAEGTYRTVTISSGSQLLSGGTYYIKTLNVSRPRRGAATTLTLNSGDYYVETLSITSSNLLKVSGTARVFIKTKFSTSGSTQVNYGGAITGLQIYLFGSATFTLGGSSRFAGVVLGTGSGSVLTLGRKSSINGALLTAGKIASSSDRSTRAINITYSDADRTTLAALSTCATSPVLALARWTMDESAWSGTAGEVQDSSGNAYHATARNGVTTESVSPAVPGSPGTCRYGQFDGSNDYLDATALPNLSESFTATAWIKANAIPLHHRILVDDQNNSSGWGFSLGDSSLPRLRFFSRAITPVILDSSYTISTGTWYFVAAVADLTNKKRHIHVFDSAGNLLDTASESTAFTGTWGSDAGPASIGGESDASAEDYHFNGSLDEVAVYRGALTTTQLATVLAESRSCISVSVPGALNAFDTDTDDGEIDGVIKTKVAGQSFSLDVVALDEDGEAVDTGFTGAVSVQILNAADNSGALDSGSCRSTWATLSSLGSYTFVAGDNGRKTLSGISVANSYRDLRVKATHTASGNSGCSTDNFAVRPAALAGTSSAASAVAATDADWQTAGTTRTLANTGASGGNVHKAGRPFSLRAQAYTATGATASNYDGSPSLATSACLLPASGCVTGTASAGSWSTTSGLASTSTASYSEAGSISVKLSDAGYAAVDAADGSSTAERTVESAAFSVGRFVPDHFDLAANTPAFAPGCASFTYQGQPFALATAPLWTVTARNLAGATTANYTGSLMKIGAATVTGQAWSDAAHSVAAVGSLPDPTVTDLGGGLASVQFSVGDPDAGGGLAYARTSLAGPFTASLTLSASVADSEGVAYAGNPYSQTGIAFSGGNSEVRFGRLRLLNAAGSEYKALTVPLSAQYWNGQGFVANTADNCTALAAPTLTFYAATADNRLVSGETAASFSNPLVAGAGGLNLSAPGAGNYGYLDLSFATPAWLKWNWDGTDQGSDGKLYDDDPVARAAFGKRQGRDRVIIRREIY